MSEPTTSGSSLTNDAGKLLLTVTPSDHVCFKAIGREFIGTSEFCNISEHDITYKIKTTTPAKFRIRPSIGVLQVGETKTININVIQGNENLPSINDKFLIMSMAVYGGDTNENELNNLWKMVGTSNNSGTFVQTHRLKCTLASSTIAAASDQLKFKPDYDDESNKLRYRPGSNQSYEPDGKYIIDGSLLLQLMDSSKRLENKQNQIKYAMILMLIIIIAIIFALIYIYTLVDIKAISE